MEEEVEDLILDFSDKLLERPVARSLSLDMLLGSHRVRAWFQLLF